MSELTSGYPPASTIYAKVFTPRVQAKNNCPEIETGTPKLYKLRSAMHVNLLFEAMDPFLRFIMHPDYRQLVNPSDTNGTSNLLLCHCWIWNRRTPKLTRLRTAKLLHGPKPPKCIAMLSLRLMQGSKSHQRPQSKRRDLVGDKVIEKHGQRGR